MQPRRRGARPGLVERVFQVTKSGLLDIIQKGRQRNGERERIWKRKQDGITMMHGYNQCNDETSSVSLSPDKIHIATMAHAAGYSSHSSAQTSPPRERGGKGQVWAITMTRILTNGHLQKLVGWAWPWASGRNRVYRTHERHVRANRRYQSV
jgi:hypothetical protein